MRVAAIVLVAAFIGICAAVCVLVAADLLRMMRQEEEAHEPAAAGPTEPVEECTTCAVEAPRSHMHLLVDTYAEPQFGRGAGTAMIAAYCRDHCPGDCTHPEEHTG